MVYKSPIVCTQALLDLAVEADCALAEGAPEPPARDFSVPATLTTAEGGSGGASSPKLKLNLEYRVAPIRLKQPPTATGAFPYNP